MLLTIPNLRVFLLIVFAGRKAPVSFTEGLTKDYLIIPNREKFGLPV